MTSPSSATLRAGAAAPATRWKTLEVFDIPAGPCPADSSAAGGEEQGGGPQLAQLSSPSMLLRINHCPAQPLADWVQSPGDD